MSELPQEIELKQGLDIIDAVQHLLAEAPGSLKDHQMRINSMEFLRERLKELKTLKEQSLSDPEQE